MISDNNQAELEPNTLIDDANTCIAKLRASKQYYLTLYEEQRLIDFRDMPSLKIRICLTACEQVILLLKDVKKGREITKEDFLFLRTQPDVAKFKSIVNYRNVQRTSSLSLANNRSGAFYNSQAPSDKKISEPKENAHTI